MKKHLLSIALLMTSMGSLYAQGRAAILESKGWFETATATWQPVTEADSYNVYYSGEGISDKKADDQLIRYYADYIRVDIPGLKAGEYTLRIVPVKDGVEGTASETQKINVLSHDRSGFAFVNGRVPGAYKADGTLKENAVVLYITENTKNTVSMEVTGANENPCVGLQKILEGFKKGKDQRPLVVRFVGQITDLAYMDKGDLVIENNNNASSYITFEGIGDDAVFDGWGLRIKNASNVEVRNVGTMNCNSSEGDNIGLQQNNDHIWVHNCDFFYGDAGSDKDQIKGDGALDCKLSNNVTFSYNHFWDSGKANLLGLSENVTDKYYITYHHNWYDHSDSRHPRVRYYSAHVYNNYYDGNSKYGVGSTEGSSVFVENNYFRNCKNPMMISMQGTDTKMGADEKDSPTFSKEDGGVIKAFGNIMVEKFTFAPYSPENTVHFDAYVPESRNEQVPASVTSKKGGNKYNNFDTNSAIMYDYTPLEASEVVGIVTRFAGRMNGGDLKWTFNNSIDDASYDVIPELKAKLIAYKTSLVSVQGDSTDSGNGGGDGNGDGNGGDDNGNGGNGGQIEGDIVHNFTTDGLTSSYFTFSGNMSDTKGPVIYNGMKLTHCLKMESSTSIQFTTGDDSELILVFNQEFNGKVKINGTNYTANNGILTISLPAGSHKIEKGDTTNLFYINVDMKTTAVDQAELAEFKIYPNPATERISISSNAKVNKVEIYNMTGSMILSVNPMDGSVGISHLTPGVYIIRVHTDKGMVQQRMIKK